MKELKRIVTIVLIIVMTITMLPVDAQAASIPKLNKVKKTLYIGQSYKIKVKGKNIKSKKFKSSNSKIATVSKKGIVKAKKVGTCKITINVKYKKKNKLFTKKLRCKITVRKKEVPITSQAEVEVTTEETVTGGGLEVETTSPVGTTDSEEQTTLEQPTTEVGITTYTGYAGYYEASKELVFSNSQEDIQDCDEAYGIGNEEFYKSIEESTRKKIEKVKFLNKIKINNGKSFFYQFQGLKEIENLNNMDLSNAESLMSMFEGCISLSSLDLSGLDISNVKNMKGMFKDCIGLSTLKISEINTENVTDMSEMFQTCAAIQTLDLSSFNTCKVETMFGMFAYCYNLEEINYGDYFKNDSLFNKEIMFLSCPANRPEWYPCEPTSETIKTVIENNGCEYSVAEGSIIEYIDKNSEEGKFLYEDCISILMSKMSESENIRFFRYKTITQAANAYSNYKNYLSEKYSEDIMSSDSIWLTNIDRGDKNHYVSMLFYKNEEEGTYYNLVEGNNLIIQKDDLIVLSSVSNNEDLKTIFKILEEAEIARISVTGTSYSVGLY